LNDFWRKWKKSAACANIFARLYITQLAMVLGVSPAALTAMIMLPSAENAAMGAHSSIIRQAMADPR